MATDQSPPRNRIIFISTMVTLLTLVALKFILDAYFDHMMTAEAKAKLPATTELDKLKEAEEQALNSAQLPLPAAKHKLAEAPRYEQAGIIPVQTQDDAPVVGWSKLEERRGIKPGTTFWVPKDAGADVETGDEDSLIEGLGDGGAGTVSPIQPGAQGEGVPERLHDIKQGQGDAGAP